MVTLAAGAGSRWTQGAGTVKALHPFCKLGGEHRTFIEVHLAKSRRVGKLCGTPLPHVLTTGYLALNSGILLMLGLVGVMQRSNPHRQFLVIAVSSNDYPGELIAYALPLAQPAAAGQ